MKKVLIYSFGLVWIDQILKMIVNTTIKLNSTIILIKDFLNLTNVKNTGASFSILTNHTYLIIVFSIIALIFIYKYLLKGKKLDKFETLSYSLLVGGILGNLIDRIVRLYVIDYIDIRIFDYDFPIFNFADICIVISVITLLVGGIYANKKR